MAGIVGQTCGKSSIFLRLDLRLGAGVYPVLRAAGKADVLLQGQQLQTLLCADDKALAALEREVRLFEILRIGMVPVQHKFQLLCAGFDHMFLREKQAILRLFKIRKLAAPPAAQTHDGAVVLVVGKNSITDLGHTIEVVADGALIEDPACAGRRAVMVKLNQYLDPLHLLHLASQDGALEQGPRAGHRDRTHRVCECKPVYQQIALTCDPAANNSLIAAAAQFISNANQQFRGISFLLGELARGNLAPSVVLDGEKVGDILPLAVDLNYILGKHAEGLQADADMGLHGFAVCIDIEALFICDPPDKLPSRFVLPGEHLAQRHVLRDRDLHAAGVQNQVRHLGQRLPGALEGFACPLAVRLDGMALGDDQQLLVAGGMGQ